MQIVMQSYRGLSLLVGLNWDRVFTALTVVAGLLAGAYLGQTLVLL